MDFLINDNELAALCGLPHIQQLAYLRGIRPYMDVKTGLVGIKRGISYQSIAEQLYVEPHQGIKSGNCSRAQIRRAISSLDRAGLIEVQSEEFKLILKCTLATKGFSAQNKVVTNPSQQAVIFDHLQAIENTGDFNNSITKADTVKTPKVDTPLKDNNYIYLLSQFEKFWSLYPEKKSKQDTWNAFQLLKPDEVLLAQIMQTLLAQIKNRDDKQLQGIWAPPWKHPVNWLTKRCWEDEISAVTLQESHNAKPRKNTRTSSTKDMFWSDFESDEESTTNNVIPFKRCQQHP